jgi:hypothetical protein
LGEFVDVGQLSRIVFPHIIVSETSFSSDSLLINW